MHQQACKVPDALEGHLCQLQSVNSPDDLSVPRSALSTVFLILTATTLPPLSRLGRKQLTIPFKPKAIQSYPEGSTKVHSFLIDEQVRRGAGGAMERGHQRGWGGGGGRGE